MIHGVGKHIRKNGNHYVAFVGVMLVLIYLASAFDFYYDINDDVLIHDILSGNYTGTPEGCNIQILYPLGMLIAFGYKIVREVPWFGLFVCGCQFGCFYLFLDRILTYGKSRLQRGVLWLLGGSFFLVFQYHTLVMVQYTVVAGVLVSTAIFLFMTTPKVSNWKEMLWWNRVSIVLLVVGFCLREEMTLLLLPILCVAGVSQWIYEEELRSVHTLRKYLVLVMVLGISLGTCLGIHKVAYSSEEWREFQELFDQRTLLYDYAVIPEYDTHQSFYEEIGLEQPQQQLLVNYNYAIDKRIDLYKMSRVAEYANGIREKEMPFTTRLRESISAYKYRLLYREPVTLESSDYPYNMIVVILYVSVVILIVLTKRFRYMIVLFLLAGVRSSLWLYIIYGLRTPVRITMPLYFAECCVLIALLLELGSKIRGRKSSLLVCGSGLLICLFLAPMPYLQKNLIATIHQKEAWNLAHEEIRMYANLHEENAYFIDVYTYVPFSEKIFEERNNLLDNYGIIGGWAARSPLETKRLTALNALELDKALLEKEHIFFVNATKYSLEWLEEYYKMSGMRVEMVCVQELLGGEIEVVKLNYNR
ncbi:MAG: hypothetical protein R3Y54_00175 [Eubacteriales bacterium]